MLLDKKKVMEFLPHRDPFLFIDEVLTVEKEGWTFGKNVLSDPKLAVGTKVRARFFAKPELDIFRGHFPGRPVLPGVIQVEMMAQASSFSIFTIHPNPFEAGNLELALVAVSEAKFRRPVTPGMELIVEAECTRYRGLMMSCDCKLFNQNELMSEASVLATVKF